MISETYRINQVGLKTKGIVRVASTQNFEDFKGFSVLNPFLKTLIADIECTSLNSAGPSPKIPHQEVEI